MAGIVIKPNRDSNKELDEKVAILMGLKILEGEEEGFYRSLGGVNQTLFTNPPQFSVNKRLVNHMLRFARENGIRVTSYDPETICREILGESVGEGADKR